MCFHAYKEVNTRSHDTQDCATTFCGGEGQWVAGWEGVCGVCVWCMFVCLVCICVCRRRLVCFTV